MLHWKDIQTLKYLVAFVFPATETPPAARGSKPQSSFSYGQPGQLFSVQPKQEAPSSISTATTNQTWKIMESLKLGPQPKANPVPTFTMTTPAPSSSTTTTTTANQDYSTVNLADIHEFFPNISSVMTQESAAAPGSTASSQANSSFSLQGSQYQVDTPIADEDIPEFPSFSEAQVPGTLDSLNMDDFEDLLNSRLMSEVGSGASMLPPCQQAPFSSSTTPVQNSSASQNTSDPASNPGSTWMNYPTSIVSLLQSEDMSEFATSSNSHRFPVTDDFDELISADEERLISIFNSGNQPGFVSGHQT